MQTRITYSMRALKNNTSDTPSQAVRPTMIGMKKRVSNTICFIKERDESITQLSCSVFALNKIFVVITGHSVLSQLNE